MIENLKGRMIEDVPYTGLIERLNMISLMCFVAGESKDHLTKQDLLNIISQISEKSVEALAFSGVSVEDAGRMRDALLQGLHVSREQGH